MKCPQCKKVIPLSAFTAELGRRTSARKAKSSRENGKLGGRPKKGAFVQDLPPFVRDADS